MVSTHFSWTMLSAHLQEICAKGYVIRRNSFMCAVLAGRFSNEIPLGMVHLAGSLEWMHFLGGHRRLHRFDVIKESDGAGGLRTYWMLIEIKTLRTRI